MKKCLVDAHYNIQGWVKDIKDSSNNFKSCDCKNSYLILGHSKVYEG